MKKIVLSLVSVMLTIIFAVTTSAYCVDCYYGNTHGYNNFAEHTYSNAYSYESPFGHEYYYQPFGYATDYYSGFNYYNPPREYHYTKPKAQIKLTSSSKYIANRYGKPILAYNLDSRSYNFENRYGEKFIGTEQHFNSPNTHSVTSRSKIYDEDGYLVYSERTHSGNTFWD